MRISIHSIKNISQQEIEFVSSKLPLRYEKAMKYKRKDDFLLCIASSTLLIKEINFSNEKEILYNNYGKPYIENNLNFNISHSGEYAAFAKSSNIIGVDIEEIKSFDDKLLPYVFQDDEIMWIKEADTLERFYILWTLKEATLKAAGCGFYSEPKNFSILPAFLEQKIFFFDNHFSFLTIRIDDYILSTAEIL